MTVFDILITYRQAFVTGLMVSVQLCLIIWSCGIILGSALGIVAANDKFLGRLTQAFAFALSAVPTLVFLFWLHYPAQAMFNVVINPFYTAAFTLSIVSIFTTGEMVRQAVRDFPQQYLIAAKVSGLSRRDQILSIQLPLLFRQLLPNYLTMQVAMLHATLFASLISVEEIFRVAQRINSTIYKPVEIYTALGVFFLAVCLPINGLAAYLKHRYTRDMSER
jgi:ABC-type amino acid transport system permease subunit